MNPQEPPDMRLGEPQSRSGHSGQEEVSSPAGNQTLVLKPITLSLYWLSYPGSFSENDNDISMRKHGILLEYESCNVTSTSKLRVASIVHEIDDFLIFHLLGNESASSSFSDVGQHVIIRTGFFLVSWGGVRLSPLGTSATNWPIVPARDDRWW
jgi:hypothetical protein